MPGPAPFAEARTPAEHHQARPLLDRAGQEALLEAREVVGGQVAEDVDVVAPWGEVLVVEVALLALRGLARGP